MTKNKKCGDQLWSLLFPPRCPVCDELIEPELRIHPGCAKKLIPVKSPFCFHCGRPLGLEYKKSKTEGLTLQSFEQKYSQASSREFCYECKRIYGQKYDLLTSNISSARALYLYQGEIKKVMYRFKYSNKREYAQFFAERAIEKYASWLSNYPIDVIVPVPMYEKKRKVRGYNQAESFARALSERTGIPVDDKLVQRVRDTAPQKNLSEAERKNNLKKAFQTRKSIVQYKHVLVVDDIYTTGATAEAVAQEIKNIGVHQIYMLSICIGRDM